MLAEVEKDPDTFWDTYGGEDKNDHTKFHNKDNVQQNIKGRMETREALSRGWGIGGGLSFGAAGLALSIRAAASLQDQTSNQDGGGSLAYKDSTRFFSMLVLLILCLCLAIGATQMT